MKRIGVYGGTFNPIHRGHIQFVLQMAEVLLLDDVFVVPASLPPHKLDNQIVSAKHRFEMCTIAFEKQPHVHISDIEIKRPGLSYTVDTLKEIMTMTGASNLYLLLGDDAFCSVDKWRGFESMQADTVFCTAFNDAFTEKCLESKDQALGLIGTKTQIFKMPLVDISSTIVRKMLMLDQSPAEFLPTEIIHYIRKHHLYL